MPLEQVQLVFHKAGPRRANDRPPGTEGIASMHGKPTRWHDREKLEGRFWAKVEKTDSCWLWTANKTVEGYGTIRQNKVGKMAHRVAYEWLVGPIAEGLELDHLCENPSCVNPAHLEPVTHQVNAERRHGNTCKYGHEFDSTKRRSDNRWTRWCTTCEQRRVDERRERRRNAG